MVSAERPLDDDSTNFDAALFRLCDEPFQISFRAVGERRHGPQAGDQSFHSSWIQRLRSFEPSPNIGALNWTTTAPSPTPEATRFTEPWRTSPTTKIRVTWFSSRPDHDRASKKAASSRCEKVGTGKNEAALVAINR